MPGRQETHFATGTTAEEGLMPSGRRASAVFRMTLTFMLLMVRVFWRWRVGDHGAITAMRMSPLRTLRKTSPGRQHNMPRTPFGKWMC